MSSVHFASQLLKAWFSMNIAGTKVSTREVHALVDEALITISTNPSETLGGAARNCAFYYYYYYSSSWGFDSGILLWVCGFLQVQILCLWNPQWMWDSLTRPPHLTTPASVILKQVDKKRTRLISAFCLSSFQLFFLVDSNPSYKRALRRGACWRNLPWLASSLM